MSLVVYTREELMNVFIKMDKKQNLASLDRRQFASLTKKRAEGKKKDGAG